MRSLGAVMQFRVMGPPLIIVKGKNILFAAFQQFQENEWRSLPMIENTCF